MSKFIVSYICLIWYSLLFAMAQNPDTGIKGRVVDELNHPVEMVNILIKGTTIGTVTNSKGEFTLPLIPKRLIVVIFSAVGFEKTERTVELPGSQPLFQVLKTNVNRIGEIVVEKKRENNDLQTIEPKLTERLPSIGGSVETI